MDRPNYEKLNVWQDSMDLVKKIYLLTQKFPKEEIHGLTSQIRRAAVSVPANIAEGHGRSTKRDFRQFIFISKGSLQEISTLIQIAEAMGYISKQDLEDVQFSIISLIRRLSNLTKTLVPPT